MKGKYWESLAGRVFDYYLPLLSFREFIKINEEEVKILDKYDLLRLPDVYGNLDDYNAYYGAKIGELSREYLITGQFPETRQLSTIENKQNI